MRSMDLLCSHGVPPPACTADHPDSQTITGGAVWLPQVCGKPTLSCQRHNTSPMKIVTYPFPPSHYWVTPQVASSLAHSHTRGT